MRFSSLIPSARCVDDCGPVGLSARPRTTPHGSVTRSRRGWLPIKCQLMPVRRQPRPDRRCDVTFWPSGGRHLWPSGETSPVQSHARGHLVYAARGVLAVHTERGTSIVPANRVAWTPAGFTHYHRAHGDTDMRIVFLAAIPRPAHTRPSRRVPGLRPRPRGPAHPDRPPQLRRRRACYSRSARARLLRVLVDELHEAHEQPLHLPEPRDDRLQAIARMLYDEPGRQHHAGRTREDDRSQHPHPQPTVPQRARHDLLRVAHAATHLSRTRPARRRPRHHPNRLRLRMGQPQQLHRSVHQHHRHDPGPYRTSRGTGLRQARGSPARAAGPARRPRRARRRRRGHRRRRRPPTTSRPRRRPPWCAGRRRH